MAVDKETHVGAEVWEYAFGYIKTSVVKCVLELEIPDILEKHVAPVSLSELSSAVDCPPDLLYRVMRFLTYYGIFKKTDPPHKNDGGDDDDLLSSIYYSPTPVSRLLTRSYLAPFVLLQGASTEPTGAITVETLRAGKCACSDNLYRHPVFSMKVFVDAMACHARLTTSAMINNYPEGFKEIRSLVDVGGSDGMATGMLVKAFPWVRGICFDLPDVVSKASPLEGIEFVGGSMFKCIPKADVVTLMWILHNWSDEECIEILKKCKEAVPPGSGKVMIIDAVVDEDGKHRDEFTGARLSMDMTMMGVFFKGKERTYKEWTYILNKAGFKAHVVRDIKTIESVIEAYP